MDVQWNELQKAPIAYIQSKKLHVNAVITSMTQVIESEQEKDNRLKLVILGVWQETACLLFRDTDRWESAISMLTDVFKHQRNTASVYFLGQVICTITSLLIQMEQHAVSHGEHIVGFVVLLFEIIEKVKSESNLLLKSFACDCLTELELSFPGLLVSKVGHFFGMSQAENSYVHQHYTVLFATVLEHAVQKFILRQPNGSTSPIQETLTDLLSYSDPLKSFNLPETFTEHSTVILEKPSSSYFGAEMFNEVKKGVLSIIDNSYLFTPACLAVVALRLMSIVESCGSLSPKILKQLLRYSSSHNVQLFHMVLLLRVKFSNEICDEGDSEDIDKWQLVHASQSQLSDEQRSLVWIWFLEWLGKNPSIEENDKIDSLMSESEDMEQLVHSCDRELKEKALLPTVFDSLDIFLYKCKALFMETRLSSSADSYLPKSVRDIVTNVLKQVEHDVDGPPAVTLYRVIFSYYMTFNIHDSLCQKEVEKLIFDITLQHPQLIQHTIDFISAVQKSCPESSLPLNLLSEIIQYLVMVDLSQILTFLPLYLKFIRHAATNKHISPVALLQLLLYVLKESSLCEGGSWEIGNTLLDICNAVLQLHPTEVIFKDLSKVLQLLAQNYNDLDIRDRARFYHQLLLTVSGGKLSAILSLAAGSAAGSTLAAIVEARISDNVFPSAPPVQILHTEETGAFLSLQRLQKEDVVNQHYQLQHSSNNGSLEKYFEEFHCEGQVLKRNPVCLQYRISFDLKPKGLSQRIFAIALKLRTSGPYLSSPDVFVPHLTVKSMGKSISSSPVTLSFNPKEPIPASFSVSVSFSTEDGISHSVSLDPIKLEFRDLFQHVVIPPMFSAEGFFSMLWEDIEQKEQKPKGAQRQGVLSSIHLDMDNEDWVVCYSDLNTFEVPYRGVDNDNNHRFMIFLPPRFHLLLKFQLYQDAGNILIATDNWDVLPLVQTYLQMLKTS